MNQALQAKLDKIPVPFVAALAVLVSAAWVGFSTISLQEARDEREAAIGVWSQSSDQRLAADQALESREPVVREAPLRGARAAAFLAEAAERSGMTVDDLATIPSDRVGGDGGETISLSGRAGPVQLDAFLAHVTAAGHPRGVRATRVQLAGPDGDYSVVLTTGFGDYP